MGLEKAYTYLYRWAASYGTVEFGQLDGTDGLVRCMDEGGIIFESPAKVKDLETALKMANEAIYEWFEVNDPDELDD